MKLTNNYNYPEAIVKAVKNDSYNKGSADFSCTELIQPSRIYALKIKHKDDLKEDVSDRIWALFGQAMHSVLERANDNDIAEVRYQAEFNGGTVSAQIDTLNLKNFILSDYKFVTAWKFMSNRPPPPEYIAQLNIQLEILRRNDLSARSLQIIGILRDWNMREAQSNKDYPQKQITTMDIPMWSRDETTNYINDRIRSHLSALQNLPFCSPNERWAKPDRFAIMRGTNKIARRLCSSMPEALDFIHNMGPGHRIETRKAESRRCESYCIVNSFCDQYKKNKELENDARKNTQQM